MEWELGRYEDEYFLFLQKDNVNIVVDISKEEAFRIENKLGVRAVEYPF